MAKDRSKAIEATQAWYGRGNKSNLPLAIQEGMGILSYMDEENQTFEQAYKAAKAAKSTLQSMNTYKGLLARYYSNVAKEQDWSKESYEANAKYLDIPTSYDMDKAELDASDRIKQGAGKIYGQFMYGIGSIAGTNDNIQAERKDYVKMVEEKEELWKAYNAKPDFDDEGGMDMPWNVAGGFGEALPYFATGALGSVGRATASGQALATALGDTIINTARYQEHGDKQELAIDLVTDIVPGMAGVKVSNLFRGNDIVNKKVLPSKGELRDVENRVKGAELLKNEEVVVPHKVLADPEAAAQDIATTTNPQRVLDIDAAKDKIQSSAKEVYRNSLNQIGHMDDALAASVPPENSGNALGYLLRNYTKDAAGKFKTQAKPFQDAYTKAGANIQLDTSELMHSAKYGIKDKSARQKVQNAIKNMKAVKEDADFDIDSINANELDDLVKQLNQDIFDNADSMSGKMTLTTVAALNDWMSRAKIKLNSLPPEFSDNYRQAKELYSKAFKLTQENTADNMGSPIKGIEKALEDKTGRSMQELFTGPDAFNNLLNLGKMMKSDHPLYGATMRNFIESKVGPNVLKNVGVNDSDMFNLDAFKESVQGIDWTLFRRTMPNSQGAVDKLQGLEGIASMLETPGKELITNTAKPSSSFFKKPGYFLQDVGDMVGESVGLSPWYKNTKRTLGPTIEAAIERTKAPQSRRPLYKGSDEFYNELKDKLDNAREMLGITEDNQFVEVNAPMLD